MIWLVIVFVMGCVMSLFYGPVAFLAIAVGFIIAALCESGSKGE